VDVKERITQKEKDQINELLIENSVLEQIVKKKKTELHTTMLGVLHKLGYDEKMYVLMVNPAKDMWEVKLADGVLVKPGDPISQGPNRQHRRHLEQ